MSEISIDTLGDGDAWHPSIPPAAPVEFDEEALAAAIGAAAATLGGRTQSPARFPASELLARLVTLQALLPSAIAHLRRQTPPDQDTSLEGLRRVLRWIWKDGRTDIVTAADRLTIATTKIVPPLLDARTQIDLMRICGTKDRQKLNRHAIEFRDFFGYFDQLGRSDSAREKFRKTARFRKTKRNEPKP